MKPYPKVLIAGLFLLLGRSVGAQTLGQYLNNYVQPAPNAAALGKYADIPVSYYTGLPEISIPIYTISDGTINVPISLSYHASGIKVSENASSVGLGWVLNAGGIIMRTVQGAPDEGVNPSASTSGMIGYYASYGLKSMPMLPYPGENESLQTNFTSFFIPDVINGNIDCEPDIYTFNFNGHVGKFVFDEYRNARLLTDDDLKISVNYSSAHFTSWKIVTSDGLQYYFGENNCREYTNPVSNISGDNPNDIAPSSWYLTRIVDPNTKDTANFAYKGEVYSYRDLGPQSDLYGTDNGLHAASQACDEGISQLNMIKTAVFGSRLSSISTRNYQIDFIGNNIRKDLIEETGGRKPGESIPTPLGLATSLDSIKIYNNNICLKQIALGHDYFVSSKETATILANYLATTTNGVDTSDIRRLKLTSVTEINGAGTLSKPPYVFTYNEMQQLPRRISFDQDFWGYANSLAGGFHNSIFIPTITGAPCIPQNGANRNPQWPYMSAYMLTGMKSELGANTALQYEANYTDNADPSTIIGGLRIQQIRAMDNITGITQIRKFTYGVGGILYHDPRGAFFITLNNNYYLTLSGGYQGYSSSNELSRVYLRQSQSIVPFQDPQGNVIGYPIIKESYGDSGEQGYKVYRFNVVQSQNSDGSRIPFDRYTAIGTIFGKAGTFGNGHFNDTTVYPNILPVNLIPYDASWSYENTYPIAPPQVDITRGTLYSVATYDATNHLLDSVQNTYGETLHEGYWIRGFRAHRSVVQPNGNGSTSNRDAFTFYKLHTGISRLVSTAHRYYKNGIILTDYTAYGYESPNHTLKTTDNTTRSNGDILINKYYYSFDYANAADNVFSKMKARNLLLPVSTHSWKNGKLVSGHITQFQDFADSSVDTLINPGKIYALETAVPLTTVQANESVNWANQQGTILPNAFFKERANFTYNGTTGKASEQQITNGPVDAYLWDYSNTYPIAEIKNSDNNSSAYTSFEADGTGNWTIGSAARDITKGLTGNQSYVLSNGNITKAGLTATKTYVVSYWTRNAAPYVVAGTVSGYPVKGAANTGWTYYEHHITGQSTVTVSGSGNIDELRLYPLGALMTTYTYTPSVGITSMADASSSLTYYEYDTFQRLMNIRDKDRNIIKHMDYHYQGQ
jgi:hypothetical protein